MVGQRKIVVVDLHHQVLDSWAKLRRELNYSIPVLTLDHHTDVLPAFSRCSDTEKQQFLKEFDYRSGEKVRLAIERLRHDEHIDLALINDIVSMSYIIAHENFTAVAHDKMRVICDPAFPEPNEMLNNPEPFRTLADSVLESEFLSRQIPPEVWGFPEIILDIDLDYLLTKKAVNPDDSKVFGRLVTKSRLITISREHDWVKILRLPNEEISDETQLKDLLNLIG